MSKDEFLRIVLKPEAISIPELDGFPFPIPKQSFKEIISGVDRVFPEMFLMWLMEYSNDNHDDWKELETAILRLADHIAPSHGREEIWVHGDEWGVVLGQVDLDAEIISINHHNRIIALLQESGLHKLKMSCFYPLSAQTANTILEYLVPVPINELNPNGTKWKLAIKHSGSTMDAYQAQAGSPYHGYWPWGLGKSEDGKVSEDISPYLSLPFLKPAQVAVQLGIFHESAEQMNLGYVPPEATEIVSRLSA